MCFFKINFLPDSKHAKRLKAAASAPLQRFYCFLTCFSERRAQRGVRILGGKNRPGQISGIYMFSLLVINGLGVLIFEKVVKSRVAALVILSGGKCTAFLSWFIMVKCKAVSSLQINNQSMKKLLVAAFTLFTAQQLLAQHSLEMLWQTDTTLKAPESALYDAKSKLLYVSNIGDFNTPNTGSISKVGLDGKIIQNNWVTGLNAPKGLGMYKGMLYAAELNDVAVIDISKAAVVQRVPVDGSVMLNDITVDANGIVYVSDTKTNKVHKVENGTATTYLENMTSANGLLAVGSDLYILTGTTFQKADAGKKLTTLTDGIEGGADGIVLLNGGNDFILTGWEGTVYYLSADGKKQTLLDGRSDKTNAADLGYNASAGVLYIPAMLKNKLIAYKLK